MALPEIRPLSFGETLDRSFAFYRSHFQLLAAICLIPGVIVSPMNLLLRIPVGAAPNPQTMLHYFGWVYLYLFLYLFIQFVALAASVFAISELYLGREASLGEAYRKALPRIGALLWMWINILVRAILCVLGAIVAGAPIVAVVIVMSGRSQGVTFVVGALLGFSALAVTVLPVLWYAFSLPVLLVEKIPVGKALKRSRQLTKGMRGQIFLTFLLMYILTIIVAFVFQAPIMILQGKIVTKGELAPAWLTLASALLGAGGSAIAMPPLMVALTLLYYNTRVLREGYDLQLMLERLGSGTAAGVAAAGPVENVLVSPEVVPEAHADVNAEINLHITPDVTPEVTPEVAPKVTPESHSEPSGTA
jgi:hypothetical protein